MTFICPLGPNAQDRVGTAGQPVANIPESDGEWEEVECSESVCEECQAATGASNQASTSLLSDRNGQSQMQPMLARGNLTAATSREPYGQHQNIAFSHANDPNMSNQSIAYQQQSTASSSLNSSKNSRIGAPSTNYPQQPQCAGIPMHHPPPPQHTPPNGVLVGAKQGIANRAASSSSCSSSSMAGQPGGQVGHRLHPRPNPNIPQPLICNSSELWPLPPWL